MKSGCRYVRAIKQSLNKRFDNKSVLNLHIAEIIAQFSHTTKIKKGTLFVSEHFHGFFYVNEVLSQNWVKGYFCTPRMDLTNDIVPNTFRRTEIKRKKLFQPFALTHVRCRHAAFHLLNKDE